MRKILAILLLAALALNVVPACAEEVFSANAVGNNGRVYVNVHVDGGKVTAIDLNTGYETAGLGTVAAEQVAKAIVDGQTLVVDAVAGATFSSKAVLTAVEAAITEAGLDLAQPVVEYRQVPTPSIVILGFACPLGHVEHA